MGPRGEQLAARAVAAFLSDGPQHLAELGHAAAARASERLMHEANLLRGAALLIGAMAVAARCDEIDRAWRDQRHEAVSRTLGELARELALAEEALRHLGEALP